MSNDADSPSWSRHLPEGLDESDVRLQADGSLPSRWLRLWGEKSSWNQVEDVDGRWISSLELEDRSRLAAERFRASGLEKADRFVISSEPSVDFVVAYVGALRAGLVVVPVNPAYTRSEFMRIVSDAEPKAALVEGRDRFRWLAETNTRLITDDDLGTPVGSPGIRIDQVGPEDPALLVYTSGTTGEPKGALLSHGNLLASATATALAWHWGPEDHLLLVLPLFHLHGLGVGINGSLSVGAILSLRPRFDEADVLHRCSTEGISLFFGVPAMYDRLASGDMSPLRGLRLLVSGSAPMSPKLAHTVESQVGQMPLERYGMSETVLLTSNPCQGVRKPGTVGWPLPRVDLRIENGEVQVRGPNVMEKYYRNRAATAEAFTEDGWFRTSDLGQVDEDGYLQLTGRLKDLIITGGYNVHPREVEEALLTHPGVAEIAVVGQPSDQWGEEVVAFVVGDRQLDANDLRRHAASNLARYKLPKRFEFVTRLPRNELGKVLRNELR